MLKVGINMDRPLSGLINRETTRSFFRLYVSLRAIVRDLQS